MIDLYTCDTPNGKKVSIALEECGFVYNIHKVDIRKGEQHQPVYRKINPNQKIPAIVDHDGPGEGFYSVFESGAILIYLAEKAEKFLPIEEASRYTTLQWLMFQMGNVGPMFGQVHHFVKYNKGKSEYSEQRYSKEAKRLYGVMNKKLANHQFVAGKSYSIADISIWPWTARFDWQEVDLNEFPNVVRWYKEMADRPAVQKGWLVPQNDQVIPIP